MALLPPLDSGGGGEQRVGAQNNGGGSSEPRRGKRELSERQTERSSGPLDETERCAVPSLSRPPHSVRPPPPPRATRQTHHNKNKYTSPPHPEPLSEHMIRAVRHRGIQPRRHSPRTLCSASASASGWRAKP